MRTGKITQTAWNRAVRRQMHTEGEQPLIVPAPAEECSGFRIKPSEEKTAVLWSSACAEGGSPQTVWYAAVQAAGNLAAKGVMPSGISVRLFFPQETEEEVLEEAAAAARDACDAMKIQLMGLHGEVTSAVRRIVVSAEAAGSAPECGLTGSVKPGQEIVLCGYAGLEGMLRILEEKKEELSGRFLPSFLEQAAGLRKELVMPAQILSVCRKESADGCALASAVRQIGSGGILAALWEMTEGSGQGIRVGMEAMTIRQETVEICEYYQVNPYQMTSAGSYLICTDHAEELMSVLEKVGARAGRLGIVRRENARVITSGEETRYLDRPASDSLMCWMQERTCTEERQ